MENKMNNKNKMFNMKHFNPMNVANNNDTPINIETNYNRNIMFIQPKSTQPHYPNVGPQIPLIGNPLIPVIHSEKQMNFTEMTQCIIEEVQKEKEKSNTNLIKPEDIYAKDKNIRRCDLHPKQLSEKCRKCKEIKNEIHLKLEEKSDPSINLDQEKIQNIHKAGNDDSLKFHNPQFQYIDNFFPVYGDPLTGNLNSLILNNILACQYFKETISCKNFQEILQEIVNNVYYAEPWTVGSSGVPSTLYCCLYKLMLLKLTESQLFYLINSRDSPYIRCLGFLYIRYMSDPKDLWERFKAYLFDDDTFNPTPSPKSKTTVGQFVESLLKDYDYYGTRLPKIPTAIEREIKTKLIYITEKRDRRWKNMCNYGYLKQNTLCRAVSFQDQKWHEAKIVSTLLNTKLVCVRFINGSSEMIDIYELNKSDIWKDNNNLIKQIFQELKERYASQNLEIPYFDSEELVDLGDIELNDPSSNEREKQLIPVRQRHSSRSRSRSKNKNRKRSKSFSSESSGCRRSKKHKHRSSRHSRSRSGSADNRKRQDKKGDSSNLLKNQIYDKIKQQDRDAALARGKDYAIKPTSYKSSLYAKAPNNYSKRSRSPSPIKQNFKTIERVNEPRKDKQKRKTDYSTEFLEKQALLKKQYGDSVVKANDTSSNKNKDLVGPDVMKLG